MTSLSLLNRAWQKICRRGREPKVVSGANNIYSKSQRTVLVAWELGGGLGHIQRLRPIAANLSEHGYLLSFVFRNIDAAVAVQHEFPESSIVQAPHWRRDLTLPPEQSGMAHSYADVLYRCGYSSKDKLRILVQAWKLLLNRINPSVVLCDHSPTAVLAAAGRIPVVHIGSGFATPPVGRPFRVLHGANAQGACEREAQVLSSIHTVQTESGAPLLGDVNQLLGFADNITCSLPELDPYRAHRAEAAGGPTQLLPKPHPIARDGFLFGYLTAEDKRVPSLLQSLANARITARVYVRRCTPECVAAVANSSITLYESPQNMTEALQNASAVLHHGGLSTAETAMAMGRPQFLLPRHLEQLLTANSIASLGCGLNLLRQKRDAGEIISRAIARGAYRREAALVAERIASRPPSQTSERILELCLKHLGHPSTTPSLNSLVDTTDARKATA